MILSINAKFNLITKLFLAKRCGFALQCTSKREVFRLIQRLFRSPVREVPYHGFMFFFAMASCAYTSFLNVYLQQLGFGEMIIGLFTTIPTLACLILQPVLAAAADRSKRPMIMLLVLIGISVLALLGQYFWQPEHPTTGAAAVMMASHTVYLTFSGTANAMNTAVLMGHLRRHKVPERYGRLRVSFSLGFTLAGVVVGWINTLTNRGFLLFAVAMFLATMGIVPLLPWGEHTQTMKEEKQRASWKELLSFKRVWILTGISFLIAFTNSFAYTFFPTYFMNQEGATESAFGFCITLRTFTEIPILFLVGWMIKKMGPRLTLLIPALTTIVRWALVALFPTVPVMIATQLFHGFGYVIYSVVMINYVADHVPVSLGATMQNLVGLITVSAPSLIGGVLGGLIIETWGMGYAAYIWMLLAVSVLASVLLLIFPDEKAAQTQN